MSQRTFSLVAGVIFLLIAVGHALRLVFRSEVLLTGWPVPMWVSAVALVDALRKTMSRTAHNTG